MGGCEPQYKTLTELGSLLWSGDKSTVSGHCPSLCPGERLMSGLRAETPLEPWVPKVLPESTTEEAGTVFLHQYLARDNGDGGGMSVGKDTGVS